MSKIKLREVFAPLYRFFKSLKLALVLILYLTLTSLLASLVPQGREAAYYASHYPGWLAWLITASGFNHFFRSFLLLFPSLLFFINLLVCTMDRVIREFRGKRSKRFGPDLIHLGLLLLLIGALLTFFQRQEASFFLAEGQEVKLGSAYTLRLEAFEYLQYPDGRPREWTSTVTLWQEHKQLREPFAIEVNHPLVIGKIKVYQMDYQLAQQLVLENEAGETVVVTPGHPLAVVAGRTLSFADLSADSPPQIIIRETGQGVPDRLRNYHTGEYIGELRIAGATAYWLSGLRAVIDPGYLIFQIAAVLLTCGLILTYLQKLLPGKTGQAAAGETTEKGEQ